MALPKLETPKFGLTVPSTGEAVEFRPFLVKEEKILMMAEESKDEKQMIRALKDIVNACTFGKLNANNLAVYDLEYIFLQLRSKSIGETADLMLPSPDEDCDGQTPYTLDLSKVDVTQKGETLSNVIQLTDEIALKLKPLSVKDVEKVSTDDPIKSIIYMIDSIHDAESVHQAKDSSETELTEFVDSLTHEQLMKINDYMDSLPKLQHTIEYTCIHTGKEGKITLEGMADFFG
jgi:hypothetical protein